jgi:hypothetical protein
MHVHQRGNRAEGGFGDGFGVLTAKFDTHAHKAVSVRWHLERRGCFMGAFQNVINLRHRLETGGINYH